MKMESQSPAMARDKARYYFLFAIFAPSPTDHTTRSTLPSLLDGNFELEIGGLREKPDRRFREHHKTHPAHFGHQLVVLLRDLDLVILAAVIISV